jgi:hypothetical protein
MWWQYALWGLAGAAAERAVTCAEAIPRVKGPPWRFPYGPGGRMYLFAVVLHCFVAMAVTGAAAAQSVTFRRALVELGLGAGASIALKALSGYTLALLPRQPQREDDHDAY